MAIFNKFFCFSQDVGRGVHNLNSNTLKIMLSDSAPDPLNDSVLVNINEIAAGSGYTAGGTAVASSAYAQTGGVGKLTGSDVVFLATAGAIAQFRYAVLYNSTVSGGPLIGWWDFGGEVNLAVGQSYIVHFDSTNGVFTLA